MSKNKRILVTGGAGYIGSHTTKLLMEQDFDVVVFDNLSTGHKEFVSCPLIVGDLADEEALNRVFEDYPIDTVIHFAADSIVEESMLHPNKYFQNNVVSGMKLLDVMIRHSVKKIVFSSSAAVYGKSQYLTINENHPTIPLNPYGESKLILEKILNWYGRIYSLSSVTLRYFNAAGAALDASLGEDKLVDTHLIPQVLKTAAGHQEALKIFGNDYPTPDGTCIRDYVHVLDLAYAHILALSKLDKEKGVFVYNVGAGQGHSVVELVEIARVVTGTTIRVKNVARRPGDPASLVADGSRIKQELGFVPQYSDIRIIIETAWNWYKKKHHISS